MSTIIRQSQKKSTKRGKFLKKKPDTLRKTRKRQIKNWNGKQCGKPLMRVGF